MFKSKYISYDKHSYTWTTYHDGNVCLVLNEEGQTEYPNEHVRLSVNVPDLPLRKTRSYEDFDKGIYAEIYIKSYSENVGVLSQLEQHGIVEYIEDIPVGFVSVVKCNIIDETYYTEA